MLTYPFKSDNVSELTLLFRGASRFEKWKDKSANLLQTGK